MRAGRREKRRVENREESGVGKRDAWKIGKSRACGKETRRKIRKSQVSEKEKQKHGDMENQRT